MKNPKLRNTYIIKVYNKECPIAKKLGFPLAILDMQLHVTEELKNRIVTLLQNEFSPKHSIEVKLYENHLRLIEDNIYNANGMSDFETPAC